MNLSKEACTCLCDCGQIGHVTSATDPCFLCSRVPGTPEQGGKTGENDSAFSFPVTPPSEPPAAVAPGAVFGSWHSTKTGSRKGKVSDQSS